MASDGEGKRSSTLTRSQLRSRLGLHCTPPPTPSVALEQRLEIPTSDWWPCSANEPKKTPHGASDQGRAEEELVTATPSASEGVAPSDLRPPSEAVGEHETVS